MGAKRNQEGPLRHARLVQVGSTDGVVFWDITRPPDVEAQDVDSDYTIEMGDRHDLLAFRKLGSSQLGWVIMERNDDLIPEEFDMRLWPNDFVPGITIKIPTRQSLDRRGIVPR
jgi:hypothetical protein